MINSREYLRRKKEDGESLREKVSFADRLKDLKSRKGFILITIVITIAIIGLIVTGIIIYNKNHTYSRYSIIKSISRDETSANNYKDFGGNILKYGLDGASYIDAKNNVLWNQAYSMQSPLADVCGDKAVIGAKKENQIYIFDKSGVIGQFQTSKPILKVKVNNQGLVLALLDAGDSIVFYLYDTNGEEISMGTITLEQTGYPLDIDISPDGGKLLISYLTIEGGVMNSKVAIYDFGEVGGNYNDNLIKTASYTNTVIPQVEYVNNNTLVVFRDNGFSIFKGKVIPKESLPVNTEEEIRSVYYSSDYIGLVFLSDNPEEKYRIDIYDFNSNRILTKDFSIEYTNIKLYDDQIIIFGGKDISILTISGKQKYLGEFDKNIQDVIKTSGFSRYTFITDTSVDQIKLH